MTNMCPDCYRELTEHGNCDHCKKLVEQPINEYTVINIGVDRIYSDSDFNCRGSILPVDVMDLVQDIQDNGLQFPIAVQPAFDIAQPKNGFDFRIVAGHRRFQSIVILRNKTIPAMVKIGLSEVQARLLNLGENMKREALNIVQEATAISHLRRLGLNRRMVSERLGVSTSWVQVRFNLLDMPDEIQAEAAAGLLNQSQIKELHSLENKRDQFEAVKHIKNARLRGQRGVSVAKKPEEDPFKAKRRQKNVVQEMIDHLGTTVGHGLHTRVLAWANGEINTAELYVDIKSFADDAEIEYESPISNLV